MALRYKELRSSRWVSGRQGEKWRGQMVFSVHKDDLDSLLVQKSSITYLFHPNYPPIKFNGFDIIRRDPQKNGYSKLIIYLQGPNWKLYNIEYASMRVDLIPHHDILTEAIDSTEDDRKYIQAEVWEGEGSEQEKFIFEPVQKGENIKYEGTTRITVRTAYARDSISWDVINNHIGKCSDHDMPLLAGAEARELKCLAAGIPWFHLDDPEDQIIPIQYTFLKHPSNGPYPEFIDVNKSRIAVISQPMEHPSSGNTKESKVYMDVTGNPTEPQNDAEQAARREVVQKKLIETTKQKVNEFVPFDDLYGLLSWMG